MWYEFSTGVKCFVLNNCRGGRLGNSSMRSESGRTPMHAGSATPMHGSQTPMYGSKTPMYGSQTPLDDGSRTPHYGAQTPLHEGASSSRTTPGGASAWDPNSGSTPARKALNTPQITGIFQALIRFHIPMWFFAVSNICFKLFQGYFWKKSRYGTITWVLTNSLWFEELVFWRVMIITF